MCGNSKRIEISCLHRGESRFFYLLLHDEEEQMSMRVLIVNTGERIGGAAVAASRLMEALNNNGVKAKMLVGDKQTDQLTVVPLPSSWLLRWHFLWERLVIFFHLHFSKKHLFEIDIANSGTDITSLPVFKEADVIHLHWINQGMLSLQNIRKILKSGKPVVWTMHDLWPATAICHYSRNCQHFTSHCHHCQLLPDGGSEKDLSSKVWKRKQTVYAEGNIFFVTCSRWLEQEAKKSALLQSHHILSIPNTINTRLYHPTDKAAARKAIGLPTNGHVLLFVSQKVTDERKGIRFFIEAIRKMLEQHPSVAEDTVIAILGGHADEVVEELPLPVHPLGFITDEEQIVRVYNAADAFVTPSLEDNLPNTIMESMACGTPCIGFRVGGIPEMIDHKKNGYVARYMDAADLAAGIHWVLFEADHQQLSTQCITKVTKQYAQSSVAINYIEVYQHAIAQNHFKL